MNITEFTLFLLFHFNKCFCKGVNAEFFFTVKLSVIFYEKSFFGYMFFTCFIFSADEKINGTFEKYKEKIKKCGPEYERKVLKAEVNELEKANEVLSKKGNGIALIIVLGFFIFAILE